MFLTANIRINIYNKHIQCSTHNFKSSCNVQAAAQHCFLHPPQNIIIINIIIIIIIIIIYIIIIIIIIMFF